MRLFRRKASDAGTPQEASDVKPFLAHLEDLRSTLIRCAMALVIAIGIAIPYSREILALFKIPLRAVTSEPDKLLRAPDNVAGGFTLMMQIGFWAGIVVSLPFIIFFISRFIAPALNEKERRLIRRGAGFGIALFIGGVAMGWFLAMPMALDALYQINVWFGIQTWWRVDNYISFVAMMLLAFGLVFEVPMFLVILGLLGILHSSTLSKYRRHTILGILIVAAVITPSPDIYCQLAISVPLYVLVEICIWVIWFAEKKRERKERALVRGNTR